MNDIIQYLKSNSNWIKDLATLMFTGTATVIAILAYRRARATVLQPKRTEIIKIQTHTLVEFLKSFSENGNNIDSSLDYINVFRYNFYYNLFELIPSKLDNLDLGALANEQAIIVTPYFEDFEKSRRHHIDDYEKLRQKPRNYFGIDDKW